ncbi:LapA family protein [Lutibacter sp. B2]|nr:LapA family protein [Lutibacter sp. B2]
MEIRFVFSLIFAIIIALFAILNSGIVTINFLFTDIDISQALVILISAVLGSIIVMLLGTIKQFKLKRKIKELSKSVEIVEKENTIYKEKNEELTIKLNEEHVATIQNIDLDKTQDDTVD